MGPSVVKPNAAAISRSRCIGLSPNHVPLSSLAPLDGPILPYRTNKPYGSIGSHSCRTSTLTMPHRAVFLTRGTVTIPRAERGTRIRAKTETVTQDRFDTIGIGSFFTQHRRADVS